MVFSLALLSTLCCIGADASCADAASCSYNGECLAGVCVCDSEWHGDQCEVLSLLPASPDAGLHAKDDSGAVSSWGATALQDDDGKWHMWASEFTNNCGVAQWKSTSRIVHATADSAEGPYTRQEVVVPLWAHGVKVIRAPTGEYVMAYIHLPISVENSTFQSVCANGKVVQMSPYDQTDYEAQSYLSWANSPNGPWSEPLNLEDMYASGLQWGSADHNLVFTINQDGSLNGLMRRCCKHPDISDWTSWLYTVRAENWRNVSTWSTSATPAFGAQLQAHGYEDPHIWQDVRRPGVYHAIMHNMVGSNYHPEVGLHAYSADAGRTWSSTGIAFNWTVALTDGSILQCFKRERPSIIFSEKGLPTHLATSCQYVDDETKTSRSMVQPIGAGVAFV